MNKVLSLTYASSLTNLCELNSSFDTGILRVAYPGDNRNGSHIDKEVFERCIKTIFNCPVVCHYDRETGSLGGHDVEVVRSEDGDIKLVHLTTPIGVVPESAKTFWQEVEEDDGTVREYLCVEVLIWKRQEAYRKIKEDGCTAQSMEINVFDGKNINGIYYIYDFEFTALALIGVEPCFESAALEFSKENFKHQFTEMMQELKESITQITPSKDVDDIHPQNFSTEGGNVTLEEKLNLIAQYELDAEALDFSLDDISIEDLEGKLKEIKEANEKFALECQFGEELRRVLGTEKVLTEWGEYPKYYFVDYDKELEEVYAWDSVDWLLYGFKYSMDGDKVIIDFESKQRKKYAIVDFDEGEQASPFSPVFNKMSEALAAFSETKNQLSEAQKAIGDLGAELDELRQFKKDTEEAAIAQEKEQTLSAFTDLFGVEAFEQLREDIANYSAEELEEKCYAIRGKQAGLKFSQNNAPAVKLLIDKEAKNDEPYGGLFLHYSKRQ